MALDTKKPIRISTSVLWTLLLFTFLVVILGRIVWMAIPQTDEQLAGATRFKKMAKGRLNLARQQNEPVAPGQVNPPDIETLPKIEKRVREHRVSEWPLEAGRSFTQAPMLDELVRLGKLPKVEARLPDNPLVVVPPEQHGPYGGTWTRFGTGPKDVGILDDRLAYDGLVRWGPRGREVIPNLATHWEIGDEGRTFTFYLRKGVRWSDGKPFTTDDILFWYRHVLMNEELTPIVPRDFRSGRIAMSVEALDKWTIRFRFQETKGLFIQKMASGRSFEMVGYPAHHLKRFHADFINREKLEVMAREKGFDLWHKLFKDEWEWRSTTTPRLWPWLMKDPPPSRPIELERNPYYWKIDPSGNQLPYIDRITFEIYDKETINFKAINGEIGMQARHLEFRNYSLLLEHQEKGGYRVLKWIDGGAGPECLLPNLNHRDPLVRELIEDRRFRIALSHAIDRDAINEIGYFGIGEPRQISPPRSSEYYDESFSHAYIGFDPEKSNRVLDSLGLTKRDANGIRLMSDGRPLSLYIETKNQNSRELEIVASNWREVGIQAEVKELARQLWIERKRALTFDVAVWGGSAGQIPLLEPRWFVPVDTNNWNAPAYGRWYSTKGEAGERPKADIQAVQAIWAKIERTIDHKEQKRLFQTILDHNRENLWVIGMVGELPSIVVVNDSFRNVPDVAVQSWMFRTPGNTAPECYAINPPAPDRQGAWGGGE